MTLRDASLLALTASALLAVLLSRRARRLRPLAVALGVQLALSLARRGIAPWLRGPVPFEGLARWVFRVDVVLTCAWPAPLVWLVGVLREGVHEGRSFAPQASGTTEKAPVHEAVPSHPLAHRDLKPQNLLPIAPLAIGLVLAAAYPHLRGPALVRAQELPRLVAVVVAWEAFFTARWSGLEGLGAWLRARRERLPVLALAAEQAVQLVSAWAPGDVARRWGTVAGTVTLAGDALLVAALWWASAEKSSS